MMGSQRSRKMTSEPAAGHEAQKTADPFALQRFVEAQSGIYLQVLRELRQGAKQSHWMWFIFPQLRGLGRSPMAQQYGLASLDEARAYLANQILGPRLTECTELAIAANAPRIESLFPYPDGLKFRSSMTLFAQIAPEPNVFRAALDRYFGGDGDRETLRLLGR